MRVVIAGQKRFGRDVLNLVIKRGWKVVGVSCPNEDSDQLRIGALNAELPIISGKFTAAAMPRDCDLIVAAHRHCFISAATRQRAELGALGYHPSLLPRHRGRSAIEWSIRFGENVTGGTVYWFNDVVDGGPIAAQDWCFIGKCETAQELWQRQLAPMGLRLFARVFDQLDHGLIVAEPQLSDLATWEPAIEGVPPLWRPDVPMIGSSRYQVITQPAE